MGVPLSPVLTTWAVGVDPLAAADPTGSSPIAAPPASSNGTLALARSRRVFPLNGSAAEAHIALSLGRVTAAMAGITETVLFQALRRQTKDMSISPNDGWSKSGGCYASERCP